MKRVFLSILSGVAMIMIAARQGKEEYKYFRNLERF
jgi:hypothetical protein